MAESQTAATLEPAIRLLVIETLALGVEAGRRNGHTLPPARWVHRRTGTVLRNRCVCGAWAEVAVRHPAYLLPFGIELPCLARRGS